MQLGTSIRSGTLWLFTGNVSQRVLEFFFGIILARLLVPADFGLLVMTQVFTGFAGFIAGGGMGQALVQSKDISTTHFRVVFTLQLLICSAIYGVFYFVSPYIALWLDNPIYTDLLRISTLNFLIRPFVNISRAKLNRDMRFKPIAIISLSTLIVSSSSSIYLAMQELGVWSLIYGGLIGSSLSALLFMIHSRTPPNFAYNKRLAKQLGGYGVKLSINDIIEYLRREAPNFMIGKMLDSTMVGLFNKGVSTSAIPLQTIAGSAYQTVFRALSSTQDNIDKSKYIYLRTITLVCVYTLPFYIGLMWLAEPFITTLYGEKWQLAAYPLQIFCIVRMLGCFGNPSGAVMAAQNMLGTEIKLQFVALIMTGLGCWYGIQKKDIGWIALFITPALFFLYFSLAFFACRRLHVSFFEFFKSILPGLFLSICMITILLIFEACKNYFNLEQTKLIYILSISALGSLAYALLFLFLPIASLKTEQIRWKQKIYILK